MTTMAYLVPRADTYNYISCLPEVNLYPRLLPDRRLPDGWTSALFRDILLTVQRSDHRHSGIPHIVVVVVVVVDRTLWTYIVQ